MQKLVIANSGAGAQGKTSSVKEVFNLLSTKYPNTILIGGADIKATIQIGDVLIGLESQGDPYSRMFDSLDDFVNMGCDIIVCACRTWGATKEKVSSLQHQGYQIIWAQNDRTEESSLYRALHTLYAEHVVQMIEQRIAGKL